MPRRISEGWLTAYRGYTEQSESPEPFHFWTAMSVLSAAVRRHVWLSQGHYTIYPNLFCILVSPPGACRKSVAMNIGARILKEIPGINMESNKMTPSSLINSLSGGIITIKPKKAKQSATNPDEIILPPPPEKQKVVLSTACSAMLFSTEFSVMLGSDSGQNGMLSLLTDLYDSPDEWKYKTIARGTETLSNVFLNILGATTPEWLGSSIPADAIGGGFTSRILFVAQNQRRMNNARPKLTQKEIDLKALLIHDLEHIANLNGEMSLTDEAEAWYINWYNNRENHTLDERFWGYLERKPDHLLKVGMLLSVSVRDDLVITADLLKLSLALLERLEERMPDAFKGIGTASAKDVERIIDQLLEKKGTMPFSELAHRNYRYLNSQDLKLVLDTMKDAGIVKEALSGNVRVIILQVKKK